MGIEQNNKTDNRENIYILFIGLRESMKKNREKTTEKTGTTIENCDKEMTKKKNRKKNKQTIATMNAIIIKS